MPAEYYRERIEKEGAGKEEGALLLQGSPPYSAIWALTPPTSSPPFRRPWQHMIGDSVVSVPIQDLAPRSEFMGRNLSAFADAASIASFSSMAQCVLSKKWARDARELVQFSVSNIYVLVSSAEQTLVETRDALLRDLYGSDEALEVIELREKLLDAEQRLNANAEQSGVNCMPLETTSSGILTDSEPSTWRERLHGGRS
ncbi:hypothetical protein TrLO_g13929 [Triparma laevis f. longispina]|uniref:Uncharacterized protein n=1 Tax=Triparma laevis f. longispina TaxID=1714387 RepID=A0A9W7CFC7_9STRA|nr:hypothetical protein TrLO_g13929 [Triparma laevis f. longispina]